MSLFRQFMLVIVFSTLLSFVGSATVSLISSRHYLEQQLILKNQDNANALALLISQQGKDPVAIELYVSALFDSGHYEFIRLSDPSGKLMIERTSPFDAGDAPVWFLNLLPIEPAPGAARISDGWKQYGSIELASQSKFAYAELWRAASRMMAWLLLAAVMSGWIAALILGRLREPLARVVAQAQAICERKFSMIETPNVPELRQLASAMNVMVERVRNMFDEETARLEAVRREVNYDAITGFANRVFFFSQFSELLNSEERSNSGSLLLLRMVDLSGINRRLGRDEADRLLKSFGNAMEASLVAQTERLTGRLNGIDFAVALPDVAEAANIARDLFNAINQALSHYSDGRHLVRIVFCNYQQGMAPATLMSILDGAIAEAEASGEAHPRRAQTDGIVLQRQTSAQWAEQLERAIKNGWLRLVGLPVVGFGADGVLHQECPLRMRFLEEGEWLAAGSFLPMATRLQMTAELDFAAIRLGISQLVSESDAADVAINLSGESLKSEPFRKQVLELLQQHRNECHRLWLEFSETSVFANLAHFRLFCEEVSPFNCRIGIEHFGREFSRIGMLHDLGLHYLKVDGSFINDIDTLPGNQTFLEGLCQIAHNMGWLVIAEGVKRPEELARLPGLGFDGATGRSISVNL